MYPFWKRYIYSPFYRCFIFPAFFISLKTHKKHVFWFVGALWPSFGHHRLSREKRCRSVEFRAAYLSVPYSQKKINRDLSSVVYPLFVAQVILMFRRSQRAPLASYVLMNTAIVSCFFLFQIFTSASTLFQLFTSFPYISVHFRTLTHFCIRAD